MINLYDKDPALNEEINKIVLEGDKYRHNKDIDSALLYYEKAWILVPEPRTSWMMPSYWIASSFFLLILISVITKRQKAGLTYY